MALSSTKRQVDEFGDDEAYGCLGVMLSFISPGDSASGEEHNSKFRIHREDIFRYEELVFKTVAQMSPVCSVSTHQFALQELETILESNPFEPSVFFEKFVEVWDEEKSLGTSASSISYDNWYDLRGQLGETVLSWTYRLKIRYNKHDRLAKLLGDLLESMLKSKPYLAGVADTSEPRIGQTILHQACADGDVSLVTAILETGFATLNKRMANRLCQEFRKIPKELRAIDYFITPTSTTSNKVVDSLSPLEVAMLAPKSDEASFEVVQILLDAGANPIVYEDCMGTVESMQGDTGQKVLFTLLHVLARGRWNGDGPYHISEDRTKAFLALLLDRESSMNGRVLSDVQNFWGLTPLQAAAAIGNKVFFVEVLDWMKVYVHKWGSAYTYGFPLKELDSLASTDICALELMALFQRTNLLNLGICESIISSKWVRFGWPTFRLACLAELFTVVCTAVVVLDETEGYPRIRWWSKALALAVAISSIVFSMGLLLVCGRDKSWFRHMPFYIFWDRSSTSFSHLLVVSCCKHRLCMAIMVLTVRERESDVEHDWASNLRVFVWHALVCIWWFDYILHILRFFEMNESTGPLAAALPEIFKKDMAPFLCIFSVLFLGAATSLRVACSTSHSDQEDEATGTLWRSMLTLEEAIHGPDVEWRLIVDNHPAMASLVFVTFLWCTLMMLAILTAMFSSRYDDLVAHTHERFLLRRASFTITVENLMPQWYHKQADLAIGRPLGGLVKQSKRAVKPRFRPKILSHHIEKHKLPDAHEKTPLLENDDDRWVIVKGNDMTFNRWRNSHGAEDNQV